MKLAEKVHSDFRSRIIPNKQACSLLVSLGEFHLSFIDRVSDGKSENVHMPKMQHDVYVEGITVDVSHMNEIFIVPLVVIS